MARLAQCDVTDLLPESQAETRPIDIPTGRDSRKCRRYYFRTLATATIYPAEGTQPPQLCYVLTRDLSRSGISFLHPAALLIGQRVDLHFPSGQKLAVEIQRVDQLEQGCFLFGCQLLSGT